MVNLSRIIWLGIGVLGTYVIITKTNFLGDFVGYIQKKSPPMSAMPSMPPMPPTSTAPTAPITPPTPSPPAPQSTPQPQNQPSLPTPTPTPSITPPTVPDNNIEGQQPSIPQSVPGRGPTSTAPVPPPPPQPQPIKTKTGRTSNNLGDVGSQSQVNPNAVPPTAGTPSAPAPQLQGGQTLFTFQTKTTGASKPGSIRLNADSRNVSPDQSYGIFANVKTGSGGKGYSPGLEITSGGPGSSPNNCCGITVGISAEPGTNGIPFIATEDWTEPANSNGKHTFFCGGKGHGDNSSPPCPNTSGMSSINVRNTTVPISWHVDQNIMPGHIVYCGRLDNKSGCGPGYFAMTVDPMYKGKVIKPNGINMVGTKGSTDPTRIRADDLGMPDFGTPVAKAEGGLSGSVPNQQPQTPPTAGTPSASNKPSTKKKSSFAGIRSMNFVTTA